MSQLCTNGSCLDDPANSGSIKRSEMFAWNKYSDGTTTTWIQQRWSDCCCCCGIHSALARVCKKKNKCGKKKNLRQMDSPLNSHQDELRLSCFPGAEDAEPEPCRLTPDKQDGPLGETHARTRLGARARKLTSCGGCGSGEAVRLDQLPGVDWAAHPSRNAHNCSRDPIKFCSSTLDLKKKKKKNDKEGLIVGVCKLSLSLSLPPSLKLQLNS